MRKVRLLAPLTTPEGDLPAGAEIVVDDAEAQLLRGAIGLVEDLGEAAARAGAQPPREAGGEGDAAGSDARGNPGDEEPQGGGDGAEPRVEGALDPSSQHASGTLAPAARAEVAAPTSGSDARATGAEDGQPAASDAPAAQDAAPAAAPGAEPTSEAAGAPAASEGQAETSGGGAAASAAEQEAGEAAGASKRKRVAK